MDTKKTAKKVLAEKTPAKKTATKKKTPVDSTLVALSSGGPLTGKIAKNKFFNQKQLKEQLCRLLELRERVTGEIISINRDSLSNLTPDPSLSDQGTDTFDREFALNQLSSEQDVLFEIDEAIRRIESGTYGVCELTEVAINIERLEALPYVRYSVKAQAELERGRSTYRPFGSSVHGM